jgi:hypothetical protein
MAKNPRKLELGPANVYITQLPRADAFVPTVTMASLTFAGQGVNAQLRLTAKKSFPGTAGNSIQAAIIVAAGNNPLTITVAGTPSAPIINVNVATTAGVGISTPNDVVAAFALTVNSAAAAIATPDVPSGTGASALVAVAAASFTGGATDPNTVIYVQSVRPGAGFDIAGFAVDYSGNAVTIQYVAGAFLSVAVTSTAIVVTVPPNTSVDQVVALLRNDPNAAFLVTAARAATNNVGTGTVPQTVAAVSLTGGSGAAVRTDVGFLGDEVAYQVTTEAADLTGAQSGNTPQDKVIIGGMVRVVIPFKEISLDNLSAGVASATVVSNSDGSKRRVDFHVAVGASMRQTLTAKMELVKIKGGFESSLPADKIIIPTISPAEGEVNFPFAPTTQRVIMTNWYAWPDPNTGRWAFFGDELP